MRRLWGWIGISFLLASALLLGASQLLPRLDAAHWATAKETTGQIVGFTGSGQNQRPLVCFVVDGGDPYVFEADTNKSTIRQGRYVTVRYFLEPELTVSLQPDFAAAQLWLGIIGCILAAVGFTALLLQMRKSSLLRQLEQYGTRVNATVTSVDVNLRISFNGRHPAIVTCTLQSPQGIGKWTVKSGWIWKLPPGIKVGGTVPVLVDVYRPGQYCVLTEEASASPAVKEAI